MSGKKKRKFDLMPPSFSYDHVVNKMPMPDVCYFHWVTVQSVRLRTLFEAVQHVVHDAVLLIRPQQVPNKNGSPVRPASIVLDRYDNSKTMVVYVNLNKMDSSTFYVAQEMKVGINLSEFYKTLKAVIQNDVVGMCIEKKKWDSTGGSSFMSLDIYIMNEADMYCYTYEYKALAIEYIPVDLPMRTTFRCQISINCANFKRYLNDCAMQGEFLKFTSTFKPESRMIETVLTPVRGIMRLARLSLSLFSPVADDFDAKAFGESEVDHEFCIASLQLFTKATTLCQNVRLLLDDNFPAVIEYDVGTMGKLRFVLAWRVNTDELERSVEKLDKPMTEAEAEAEAAADAPTGEDDLELELSRIERDVTAMEDEIPYSKNPVEN